jgi:hypothetical protein
MARRHVVTGSNKWKQHWLLVALLAVWTLAGCAMPQPTAPATPAQTVITDATATAASRIIDTALGTAIALPSPQVVEEISPQSSIAPTATSTPSPLATPTALPTRTPTPTPTATPTATPFPLLYEHVWTVRATDADDVSALFVNGKMVGAAMRDGPVPDTGWVTINRELEPALDNIVTFASSNRGGDFSWRFDLRQDETAVWTAEQKGKGDVNLLQYVQQVVVAPDGSVVAASPPDAIRRAPPGRWYVRMENVDDVAAALVNGMPVALVSRGWDSDWVEITGGLSNAMDNTVRFAVWNFIDAYSWRLQLRHDDVIVWGKEESGGSITGLVADLTVAIDGNGQVSWPDAPQNRSDPKWAVRGYATDDLSAIFVDQRLVGVATYETAHRDTGWLAIDRLLTPGQPHVVTVASANTGGDYRYGFILRQDDVQVWGVEGKGNDKESPPLQSRQVAVAPDGRITTLAPAAQPSTNPPGRWYLRLQNTDDVAAVQVNDVPIAVVDRSTNDWIEITDLLDGERDNDLRLSVWNLRGDYGWDLALRRDDATVWSRKDAGTGPTGLVFNEELTINSRGQLLLSPPRAVPDEWATRSFNTDDVSAIFVNGRIVSATTNQGNMADSGWVTIDGELNPDGENLVAFGNGNTGGNYGFGFTLRRNGAEVWTAQDGGGGERTSLQYAQRLRLAPDGSVEVLPPLLPDDAPPGRWYVRIENDGAIVAVQVNGSPVAVVQNGKEFGWIDITTALRADRVNEVRLSAWSVQDSYALDMKLKHDDTIIWSQEESGANVRGLVYDEQAIINGDGEMVAEPDEQGAPGRGLAVRAYAVDDVSVVFVNRMLVAAATFDDGRSDTGWVAIDAELLAGADNELAFAHSNTGGDFRTGFLLRRDQTGIWGVETAGRGDNTPLQDGWRVVVAPDGGVAELPPPAPPRPLAGRWYVRAEEIDDVAGILVNGIPVAVAGRRSQLDWVEISDLLNADGANVVTVAAWNFEGNYRWRFSLRRDYEVVWTAERAGSGVIGRTVNQDVFITPSGEVHAP